MGTGKLKQPSPSDSGFRSPLKKLRRETRQVLGGLRFTLPVETVKMPNMKLDKEQAQSRRQLRRSVSSFRNPCRPRFRSQAPDFQNPLKKSRTCCEGPFGENLRATGPMAKANPFRFSTKHQDDETDLLMYALRPYNPSTGRFLCKDPIGELGGRNLYGFVGNDPVDRFDPLGLMSIDDFNYGITTISEGPNDIGFLEGALRWFFGSGRDVHVPFKDYDPGWGPSDFDGFDAAVKSVCSKCPTWQPGREFTRVRDLYKEGGKTIFIKGGPGRINVRLKGNMSSFAHYCPCKWRFRGDVTIDRDAFNFDPHWFNSGRIGSGELITRIIWLIHLLGVGTDFNVYFDGSRFVDVGGDCPKN